MLHHCLLLYLFFLTYGLCVVQPLGGTHIVQLWLIGPFLVYYKSYFQIWWVFAHVHNMHGPLCMVALAVWL